MTKTSTPASLIEALASLDSRIPDLLIQLRQSQAAIAPKFGIELKRPSGAQNSHFLSQVTQRTGEDQYALRPALSNELVLMTIASNME
jgi:hypothetical protein